MSNARPVAWERFAHDPRAKDNAMLRASDADRDVALDALGAAYGDGRLDRTEFDERSGMAQSAKTLGELMAQLRDLAPDAARAGLVVPTPALLQQRAEESYRRMRQNAFSAFLGPTLICWVIWGVTMFGGFPWPVFVMVGTGIRLVQLVVNKQSVVADQRQRIERKEQRRIQRRPK